MAADAIVVAGAAVPGAPGDTASRGTPLLANMSAPPRSFVRLPRLSVAPRDTPAAATDTPAAWCGTPVGPGGGQRLSHALRLTQIDLPGAVHAALRLPLSADLLVGALGMARALVALARRPAPVAARSSWPRAIRRDIEKLGAVAEAALLDELCARLAEVTWPAWVPRVALAIPLGMDPATRVGRCAPTPPPGVCCPLLAARLVSAIRGPAFLRDAPPTLSNLLEAWRGPVASGCWELWMPLRPGATHAGSASGARTGDAG